MTTKRTRRAPGTPRDGASAGPRATPDAGTAGPARTPWDDDAEAGTAPDHRAEAGSAQGSGGGAGADGGGGRAVGDAAGVPGALLRAAEGLGAAERRIAGVVVRGGGAAVRRGPAALLKAADAGPLDLDRLLGAAGVAGFAELAAGVRAAEDRRLTSPQARFGARLGRATSAQDLFDRAAEREAENLTATLDALRANGALELAAERVAAARRRYVTGGGKSHAYAVLLAADLAAGMSGVTTVDGAAVRPLDVLGDVRAGDLLVAFSLRRYTRATLAFAAAFRAAGGEVVGVTDDPAAPLVAHCDVAVVVRTASVSYADSPTAVAAAVHVLATLSTARAKGARRRLERRGALAESLDLYQEK